MKKIQEEKYTDTTLSLMEPMSLNSNEALGVMKEAVLWVIRGEGEGHGCRWEDTGVGGCRSSLKFSLLLVFLFLWEAK